MYVLSNMLQTKKNIVTFSTKTYHEFYPLSVAKIRLAGLPFSEVMWDATNHFVRTLNKTAKNKTRTITNCL